MNSLLSAHRSSAGPVSALSAISSGRGFPSVKGIAMILNTLPVLFKGALLKGVCIAALLLGSLLPNSVDAASKVKEDLPNFHKVHPFLYRGGEPTPAGVRRLAKMGIKTIVDLRAVTDKSRQEKALAQSLGIKYVQLPMSSAAPTQKQVSTFLALVDKAQCDQKPLFVHCQHGSDRAGCMVGIYRVTRDKWPYDKTYAEMRKYWFTPKFTKLSGAVKQYAAKSAPDEEGCVEE
jgi:protein tyrosine phosphatase (PTP) superfamily phosphohydrolase (DUF442 family)